MRPHPEEPRSGVSKDEAVEVEIALVVLSQKVAGKGI